MNDLHYIFYEPKRMFVDTSDMSCEGERAHRRLCDYSWFNDGPPLNNNKSLRQISHTEEADWPAVKRELLAKGWLEKGDYFLHRGVIKSLNESKEKYVANHNRSAKMNQVEPLGVSVADAVTGCVTIIVTSTVTPIVTRRVTGGQSESDKEKESDNKPPTLKSVKEKGCGEKPADTPSAEIPDEKEAVTLCMTAGIPEKFVRHVHRQWSMQSGRNANGVIVAWLPYVTGRWANEQVEWKNGTHRGNRKTPGPANPRLAGQSDDVETKRASVAAARLASERK